MATVEVVSATPALAEERPEAAVKEEVIAPEPEPKAVNEEAKEEQTVDVEEVPAPVVVAVEPVSEEKEVKEGEEVVEVAAAEEEKEEVSEPKDTSKIEPKPVVEEEKAVVAEAEETAEDHVEKVVVVAEEIKEGGKGEGEAPAAEKAE